MILIEKVLNIGKVYAADTFITLDFSENMKVTRVTKEFRSYEDFLILRKI